MLCVCVCVHVCVCVAKLNQCLELMRNILGENFTEATMMTTAIESGFNVEQSINQLLTHSRTISIMCAEFTDCVCVFSSSVVFVVICCVSSVTELAAYYMQFALIINIFCDLIELLNL